MQNFRFAAALAVVATVTVMVMGGGSALACSAVPSKAVLTTATAPVPALTSDTMISLITTGLIELVRMIDNKTLDIRSDGGLIDVKMSESVPSEVKIRNIGKENKIRIHTN